MSSGWTFRRTLAAGFAGVVVLNLIVATIALVSLTHVVQRKDRVIDHDARLVLDVQRLLTIRDARAAANRGYLISQQRSYLEEQYRYDIAFRQELQEIRGLADTTRGRALIDQVATLQAQFVDADREPVRLRQLGTSPRTWTAAWEKINGQRVATSEAMDSLFAYQMQLVEQRKVAASSSATRDTRLIIILAAGTVLASIALAIALTRRLRRRIGGVVAQVQDSSAELQTSADQQAVGAKEQATAVAEISTTMSELLASAQQITSNAQQVASTAGRTASAGAAGTTTVAAAQLSMGEIRRQVDAIVLHMAELSDKSERIGAVLNLVTGLAEQTNILAINSTIEAAGASGSGQRFAVVADEIRKLADRVGESTKEIRELIEGVRGAVDTTSLATERGAKAVERGSAQVEAVASSFEQIVSMVETTTEAAREIELATKQQDIAVEQVNLAMNDVARSTRDTEYSSEHTLATVTRLRRLSVRLHRLIESSDAIGAGQRSGPAGSAQPAHSGGVTAGRE